MDWIHHPNGVGSEWRIIFLTWEVGDKEELISLRRGAGEEDGKEAEPFWAGGYGEDRKPLKLN